MKFEATEIASRNLVKFAFVHTNLSPGLRQSLGRLTISRVCSLRNLISSPGFSKRGWRRPTAQRSSVKYSGVVFLTATWELIYRVMKFTECSTRSPKMGNRVKHEQNYK